MKIDYKGLYDILKGEGYSDNMIVDCIMDYFERHGETVTKETREEIKRFLKEW